MNNAQKALREHIRQIGENKAACGDIPDAILDYGEFAIVNNRMDFDMPWSVESYRAVRGLLGRAWKRAALSYGINGSSRHIALVHRKTDTRLNIWLYTYKEGATCHQVQVGEKTIPERTVPIYEIVCDE